MPKFLIRKEETTQVMASSNTLSVYDEIIDVAFALTRPLYD